MPTSVDDARTYCTSRPRESEHSGTRLPATFGDNHISFYSSDWLFRPDRLSIDSLPLSVLLTQFLDRSDSNVRSDKLFSVMLIVDPSYLEILNALGFSRTQIDVLQLSVIISLRRFAPSCFRSSSFRFAVIFLEHCNSLTANSEE